MLTWTDTGWGTFEIKNKMNQPIARTSLRFDQSNYVVCIWTTDKALADIILESPNLSSACKLAEETLEEHIC